MSNKKIVFIEDNYDDVWEVFKELFRAEIIEYLDFRPYIKHSGPEIRNLKSVEKAKLDIINTLQTEYHKLSELYKLISRENEREIFDYLYNYLDIEKTNYIIIDVSLKGRSDDEGLRFYRYLVEEQLFEPQKIIVLSVSHRSILDEQFRRISNSDLPRYIILKDKAITFPITIKNIINE